MFPTTASLLNLVTSATVGLGAVTPPPLQYAYRVTLYPIPLGPALSTQDGGMLQTFTTHNAIVSGPLLNASVIEAYISTTTYNNSVTYDNQWTYNTTDGDLLIGRETGVTNAQGTAIRQSVTFGGPHANLSQSFFLCYAPPAAAPNGSSTSTAVISDCWIVGSE